MDIQGLVIDLGSGVVKGGFAGDDAPRAVFDNVVGSSRNPSVMSGINGKQTFIGDEAQMKRGALSLTYPMEHGIIQNWDAIEKIMHHTIYTELRVAPEEHPVMIAEHPLNPRTHRERLCQLMFESFAVPAYYSALSPVLGGYACGHTSQVIVDIGDGVISIIPTEIGMVNKRAVRRVNFAGRDLTNYMSRMLAERGYYLNRSSDFQTVRDIKEKLCYMALDYDHEIHKSMTSNELVQAYEMPDGQKITLNSERFQCPEALFKPSMVGLETPGIHELIHDSISSLDRTNRWYYLILSGGSTFFPGFAERLEKELQALVPAKRKVQVIAPPERKYSTWIGGSILASLSTFEQLWISKEEYDEGGPYMVSRKCYNGY